MLLGRKQELVGEEEACLDALSPAVPKGPAGFFCVWNKALRRQFELLQHISQTDAAIGVLRSSPRSLPEGAGFLSLSPPREHLPEIVVWTPTASPLAVFHYSPAGSGRRGFLCFPVCFKKKHPASLCVRLQRD
ncbi:MAG: hypothetical protein EOS26_29790 [Mesorhizobium sp.]|nr:MAG: hypothetical protein EOS26_29790 [Mesorhizobium sp.]